MSRKAKIDALIIAAVQVSDAIAACYTAKELAQEMPKPVLVGQSKLLGALRNLGMAREPGLWADERERQRQIGRDELLDQIRDNDKETP